VKESSTRYETFMNLLSTTEERGCSYAVAMQHIKDMIISTGMKTLRALYKAEAAAMLIRVVKATYRERKDLGSHQEP
jgi:hypothetical protein